MSIKMINWVWENSETSGSQRLVLLALADYADEDCICWPSQQTIAHKCRLSRDYVKDILADLEKQGCIRIINRKLTIGNRNMSNIYKILTPRPVVREAEPPTEIDRGVGLPEGREDAPPRGGDAEPTESIIKNHHLTINSPQQPSEEDQSITAWLEEKEREKAARIDERKNKKASEPRTADQVRADALSAMLRGGEESRGVKADMLRMFSVNVNLSTKTGQKFVEFIKECKAAGQSLDTFARWWWENDWRGKRGNPPSVQQVQELWPQAFKITQPAQAAPAGDDKYPKTKDEMAAVKQEWDSLLAKQANKSERPKFDVAQFLKEYRQKKGLPA